MRGTWTCQKEETGIPAVRWRKKKAQRDAVVATQTRVEPTRAGECKLYKEERDVLEEEMGKIDGCAMEKFVLRYPRRWAVTTDGQTRRTQDELKGIFM